ITPFPPTLAPTITACAPPLGWVRNYIVQPGDTLFRISGLYGISASQLQRGNCLNSTLIVPGQRLWVPNVATRTFTASPTGPASATPSPTPTGTPSPSNTPAPDTETPTPTDTATPTESPTPFPRTDTPTATP
ncbi:MAG: LysM peptidoglycan-binding domain-containing protein, partial [Chloroflexota bacterium]